MLAAIFSILDIVRAETLLRSKGILHQAYKPVFLNYKVYFPIERSIPEITKFGGHVEEVDESFFPKRPRRVLSLPQLERVHGIRMPRSLSIVGDIILINEIPDPTRKKEVGDILSENYGVRAVFLKIREVSGKYRIAQWELLSGYGDTFTVHRENNFYFALDASKVFFNPRMGGERNRVIQLVKDNEVVIDMFTGIGPFAIPIAKKCAKVYAIDLNPSAIEFANLNANINKVSPNKLTIFHADAAEKVPELGPIADRIIMNYPEASINFLEPALMGIKRDGGIVHFYIFVREKSKEEDIKKAREIFYEKTVHIVRDYKILNAMASREVAPRKYMVVLDVFIRAD